MTQVKVLDSTELLTLNKEAEKRGFNRQLTDQTFVEIDPDGWHVVTLSMPHGDADHVRLGLLLKMANKDDPVEVFLDVTWEHFHALRSLDLPEKEDSDD